MSIKRILKLPRLVILTLVVVAGLIAAGLVFLGTHNVWLTVVAGLAGLVVMRIWWICERRHLEEKAVARIARTTSELAQSINVLSLEVADLDIQFRALADKS